MKKYPVKLAAIGAAAVLLSGCTAGAANNSDSDGETGSTNPALQSLYEAAIESGQTQALGYVPNAADQAGLVEKFNEEFPDITIELVSIFGAELDTRLNAEALTGGIEADFTTVGPGEILNFMKNGWMDAYIPETAGDLDDSYIGPDQAWVTPALTIQGPIYNTTNLDAADVPASWADMVNPALKGRAVSTPPTSAGGFPMGTMQAYEMGIIDDQWLEDLAALEPTFLPNHAENVQAVVSGQADYHVTGPYQTYFAAQKKGAPLGFVFLEEGNVGQANPIGLFKDSPNSDAAKLFASWLFTPAAQAEYLKAGWQGSMPDAPRLDGIIDYHMVTTENLQTVFPAWREKLAGAFE